MNCIVSIEINYNAIISQHVFQMKLFSVQRKHWMSLLSIISFYSTCWISRNQYAGSSALEPLVIPLTCWITKNQYAGSYALEPLVTPCQSRISQKKNMHKDIQCLRSTLKSVIWRNEIWDFMTFMCRRNIQYFVTFNFFFNF
jgi:hypothetical protein